MKRLLMPLRRSVLVMGVLLGAGAAVSAPKQDAINLKFAYQSFNLEMTPQAVTGADFQMARSPGALKGRALGRDFTLTLTPGRVEGAVGGAPVNVKVTRKGDVIVAEGGFGGRPVNLTLSPSELTVYVRDCTYRLKAEDPNRFYTGRRSCDRAMTPGSEIWLPDEFLAASPEEKAAILFLTL